MKKTLLLLLAVSGVGYAATAACPTATVTSQDPSGSTYFSVAGTVTTPGTGSATATSDNALNNLNVYSGAANSTTGGCLQTDMAFNNFRVLNTDGDSSTLNSGTTQEDLGFASPGQNGVYAGFSGTAGLINTTVTTEFSTVRGDGAGAAGATNDGVNNWVDFGGSGNGTNITSILFSVEAGANKLLNGSSLLMRFYNFTSDAANTVTVRMCGDYTAGTLQTTAFTTCGGAGNPGGTVITAYTSSLANLISNDNTFDVINSNSFAGFSRVYVNLTFQVDGSGNNATNSFGNSYLYGVGMSFTESTPEPSSILLMGAGLAGLGLVARRRRKA